jgi:hypothetical protein
VDCTLAALFPAPDLLGDLSQLQHRYAFGDLLLVVEQIPSFLERCSRRDLALVAAPAAGRSGEQAAILGALVTALTMARHERVVVTQGDLEIDRINRALADEKVDVVLPPSGTFCPGGYRRSCLRPLERALRQDRLTPEAALKGLRLLKLE